MRAGGEDTQHACEQEHVIIHDINCTLKIWQQQVLQERAAAMIHHLPDDDREQEERPGEKQRVHGYMGNMESNNSK